MESGTNSVSCPPGATEGRHDKQGDLPCKDPSFCGPHGHLMSSMPSDFGPVGEPGMMLPRPLRPQSCHALLSRASRKKMVKSHWVQNVESYSMGVGDREAAYELEAKGQEHIQLAQQARRRTNQAAFIGSNLTNLCRMTVSTCLLHPEKRPLDIFTMLLPISKRRFQYVLYDCWGTWLDTPSHAVNNDFMDSFHRPLSTIHRSPAQYTGANPVILSEEYDCGT